MKLINNLALSFAGVAFAVTAFAADPTPTPTPTPAPPPKTDAEVIGFMATANDGEINLGQVAATKGQKAEVKAFGAKMVIEHSANNLKLQTVETKSGIPRADSDASKELKAAADAVVENLKSAKDADFDKAYIDSQVQMHQQVLDSIDKALLPAVQNADIKTYLEETRVAVAAHLEEAQKIQKDLAAP